MAKLLDIRASDGLAAGAGQTYKSRSGWVASAFRSAGGAPAANAIDGNAGTWWQSGGAPLVTSGGSQDWFSIDMGSTQSPAGVRIENASILYSGIPSSGDIKTSPDAVTWTTQASWTVTDMINTASGIAVLNKTFPAVSCRYVRLYATGQPLPGSGNWWNIGEINLLSPANGIVPRVGGAQLFIRASTGDQVENGGGTTTIAANIPLVSWFVDPVSSLYVPTYLVNKAAGARAKDCLYIGYTGGLQAMTVFLDMYDTSPATFNDVVCDFGDSTVTGPYLSVRRNADGGYMAIHHNGTTGVTGYTSPITRVSGARIRLRIVLSANGSVQTWCRVNNAAEITDVNSGALTIVAAPNQPWITLGADYPISHNDNQGFASLQAATGVLTAFPSDSATRGTYGTRRGSRQIAA